MHGIQVNVTEVLSSLTVINYRELKCPSRSSNFSCDECVSGEWNTQHFLSDKKEWPGILLFKRPSYIIHEIIYICVYKYINVHVIFLSQPVISRPSHYYRSLTKLKKINVNHRMCTLLQSDVRIGTLPQNGNRSILTLSRICSVTRVAERGHWPTLVQTYMDNQQV